MNKKITIKDMDEFVGSKEDKIISLGLSSQTVDHSTEIKLVFQLQFSTLGAL